MATVDSSAGGAMQPMVMGMESFVPRGAKSRVVVMEHSGPISISAKQDDGEVRRVALPVMKDDPPLGLRGAVEFEDAEARVAEMAVEAEADGSPLSLDGAAFVMSVEKGGVQFIHGLVERKDGAIGRLIEAYLPPIEVGLKTAIFSSKEEKIEVIPATKRVVAEKPDEEWFPPIINDGEKRIATYVVLEPDEVDKQGDIYGADVIETAAHDFLANYNKNKTRPAAYDGTQTGVRHVVLGVDADVVESYIAPADLTFGEQTVKKGSWIASVQYRDEDLWGRVRAGELSGISIGGAARAILLQNTQEKS